MREYHLWRAFQQAINRSFRAYGARIWGHDIINCHFIINTIGIVETASFQLSNEIDQTDHTNKFIIAYYRNMMMKFVFFRKYVSRPVISALGLNLLDLKSILKKMVIQGFSLLDFSIAKVRRFPL